MTKSGQPLLRLQPEGYSRQRHHQDYGGGYALRAVEGDVPVAWRTLDADRHGARVVRVASVQRHPVALQETDFLPGQPVELRPDPEDPDNPAAIGVWSASGRTQVGHVSRQDLYDVRRLIFAGEPVQAIVVWDWRTEGGMRRGLNLLVARVGVVEDLDAPSRRFEAPPETRGLTHPLPVLGFGLMVLLVLAGLIGSPGVLIGGVLLAAVAVFLARQRTARGEQSP